MRSLDRMIRPSRKKMTLAGIETGTFTLVLFALSATRARAQAELRTFPILPTSRIRRFPPGSRRILPTATPKPNKTPRVPTKRALPLPSFSDVALARGTARALQARNSRWPDCTLSRHAPAVSAIWAYTRAKRLGDRGGPSLSRFLQTRFRASSSLRSSSEAFRRSCPEAAAAASPNIDRFLPTCVRHNGNPLRCDGCPESRRTGRATRCFRPSRLTSPARRSTPLCGTTVAC